MSVQNQDLVFHRDNSLISDLVLTNPTNSYLSIISHKRGTSPTWLLNSLIENSTNGSANLINSELKKKPRRSNVFFISFLHPEEFYKTNCIKNGIDLSSLPNFHFIDCFTNLFTDIVTNPSSPKSGEEFKEYFESKVIPTIKPDSVVFIEGPELLLSSTSISSNQILSVLTKLNRSCKQLFIVCGQEYPESFDLTSTNDLDPVFKTADFLIKLYHKSQLNINLKPLPTGRAKDITGCLTISKGTIPYEGISLQVWEREYIYLVSKDGNVKLYFR